MPRINPIILKQLRKTRGWSLASVADKTAVERLPKINPQTIWRLENGRHPRPRRRTMFQIAYALGVEPRVLMDQSSLSNTHDDLKSLFLSSESLCSLRQTLRELRLLS
jgi:transcriptional regulator with XRE-family HTH domain